MSSTELTASITASSFGRLLSGRKVGAPPERADGGAVLTGRFVGVGFAAIGLPNCSQADPRSVLPCQPASQPVQPAHDSWIAHAKIEELLLEIGAGLTRDVENVARCAQRLGPRCIRYRVDAK